jgi:poly-gamma-glutamate capsule biosynthesis protein CapA/YwtB (metallophosphatase superfamily)
MPRQAKPTKASPPQQYVVPVEVEQLILRLYPEASTRHSILLSIHGHIARLQAQGRDAEIPAFIQQEIDSMNEEHNQRQKSKRRKLLTIVGRVGLTAFAIASHWKW